MQYHPHHVLRDALSKMFVAAVGGNQNAALAIEDFYAWSQGATPSGGLRQLETPIGEPLFVEDALNPIFEDFQAYAKSRASFYRKAYQCIVEEGIIGNSMELGIFCWNFGLFFETHEILEPIWLIAERTPGARNEWLEAIIAAATAMHHFEKGNYLGALSLLRTAVYNLERFAGQTKYNLELFTEKLDQLAQKIECYEVQKMSDIKDVPRILHREFNVDAVTDSP